MKKIITSLLLFGFFTQPVYSSQQMRDMSLSVEETNRQLATPQAPINYGGSNIGIGGVGTNNGFDENSRFDPNASIDDNMTNQLDDINALNSMQNNISRTGALPLAPGLPAPRRGQGQQGLINKLCSSAYTTKTTTNAALQSCIDTQRQQVCERFRRAAVNIQRVISQAVDCESNVTGYIKADCSGLDASRLDLLKQYWQDEDSSYTILFLPDMVLNPAANCAASTKRGM